MCEESSEPILCSVLKCRRCSTTESVKGEDIPVSVPALIEGEKLKKLMKEYPTFDQVVGLQEAKREVNRIIDSAKMVRPLSKSKTRISLSNNFILLVGFSGTGNKKKRIGIRELHDFIIAVLAVGLE